MKILFHNAKILTMKDDKIIQGDLLVIDKRIVYIGNDASEYAPFDRIIDCQGNLLMPGFKNAHAHSAMVFLRNRGKNLKLQDWLFKFVFPREAKLIPSDVYHLNKVAYLEYLSGGVTACFDHYFFPLEAAKAAEEVGMRTLLLATCDPGKTSVEDLERNYNFFKSKEEGLVSYIAGFHAEYTADAELIKETREAIAKLKCPFFTHISETKKEVDECLQRNGKTPLEFLYSPGLFKYGGGGFHCVHLTDQEIDICRENHLSVISCPGSNLYLHSGIAPLKKYLDNNINIALGTDGPASNETLDMFREMRLVLELEQKTNNGKQSITPFEVLKMATVNGAKAMEMFDSDVLDINKYADLIMIDCSQMGKDIISDAVNKAQMSNVKLTMINGKILYENGEYHLKQSVEEIVSKVEEISNRIEKDL